MSTRYLWLNPFRRIAGAQALLWGTLSMLITAALRMGAGVNINGIMKMGRVFSPEWLATHSEYVIFAHYLAEQVVIWLVPALLFGVAGVLASKSRIRLIDVLGTTAFAQIPLVLMMMFYFAPPVQFILSLSVEEVVNPAVVLESTYIIGIFIIVLSLIFMAWSLVWLYQAFRVSCNLSGITLGLLYAAILLGGDLLTRFIIGYCLH